MPNLGEWLFKLGPVEGTFAASFLVFASLAIYSLHRINDSKPVRLPTYLVLALCALTAGVSAFVIYRGPSSPVSIQPPAAETSAPTRKEAPPRQLTGLRRSTEIRALPTKAKLSSDALPAECSNPPIYLGIYNNDAPNIPALTSDQEVTYRKCRAMMEEDGHSKAYSTRKEAGEALTRVNQCFGENFPYTAGFDKGCN